MTEELAEVPDAQVETPEAVETPEPSEAQTDAPEDTPSEQDKPEPTEAEKIRYAMQKRIDRQTARSSQLEQELNQLRERVSKYEQPQKDEGPKESEFDTVEEYLIAKGKWEAKQEFAKAEQEKAQGELQKKQQEAFEAKRKAFEEKEAEFRKTTPDYDDAVQVLNEYVTTVDQSSQGFQVFRDVLMNSNDMAAMSYHLGKNPDLVESLASKTPVEIARTLFRLELELENAPKTAPKPTPAPPSPTSASPKASNKPLDEMSYAELKKWRSS